VVDGSHDAASFPDATVLDGASDGAAADEAGDGESGEAATSDAPDDGAQTGDDGGRQCLPDGSGSLRFRTSLALSIDDTLGDADSCNGVWTSQRLTVSYFVPLPLLDGGTPTGILTVFVDGLAPGTTVTGKPVMFSLVGDGIWDSPAANDEAGLRDAACDVDITLAQPIGTNAYKVQGAVHCSAPVPSAFAGKTPLQIDQFDFVIKATM
jgi:hypothetical protein